MSEFEPGRAPGTEVAPTEPNILQHIGAAARRAFDAVVDRFSGPLAVAGGVGMAGVSLLAPATVSGSTEGSERSSLEQASEARVMHRRPPHTVRYLVEHCPIVLAVNLENGHPNGAKQGVTAHAKRTQTGGNATTNTPPKPTNVYTWHLPKRDKFCGIVGTTYGPVYKSLKPTSETAHGGTYVDTSPQNPPLKQIGEFFVYARQARVTVSRS